MCALLLERAQLPLDGPYARDSEDLTPLDRAARRSQAFSAELIELHEAIIDRQAGLGAPVFIPRQPGRGKDLIAGRYQIYGEISKRIRVAQDLQRHVPVVLKCCKSAEAATLEAEVMSLVGPDIAPEVYGTLRDEHSGEHQLVMQAADSTGSMSYADLPQYLRAAARKHARQAASNPPRRRDDLSTRSVALRLLQCVVALHDKGLVHADLKAKHFMRFSGDWKLIDYDTVTPPSRRHPRALLDTGIVLLLAPLPPLLPSHLPAAATRCRRC